MLTEVEQQQFTKMLSFALLEMRILGWNGRAEQAADLADAFHNLPAFLWSDEFSISFFREFLNSYQEKYKEASRFNYVNMLDRILADRESTKSV